MKRISWIVGLVLALGSGMVAAADDGVNIVELPGLGKASRATWMNDSGWVIGYSTADSSPAGAVDTPFVYRPGLGMRKLAYGTAGQVTVEVINNGGVVAGEVPDPLIQNKPFIWTSAHGFIINDNMPTDWWPSHIRGINSGNVVAGWSQDEIGRARPFRWNPAGRTEALTVPNGTAEAYAEGINHGGQVAGFWRDYRGTHAVVWEAEGQMTRVGPPPGTDGEWNVKALGINDDGLVAGIWYPSSGPSLFIWSRPKGFRNIGPLPGDISYNRFFINNAGQIAGNLLSGPFIWDSVNGFRTPDSVGAQFMPDQLMGNLNNFSQVCGESVNGFAAIAGGGSMAELGALGGNSSEGVALNDRGMVAGFGTAMGGSYLPFLWDGTSMLGLGSGAGIYTSPIGINNSGSVLVQGGFPNYGSWVWDPSNGFSPLPDLGGLNSTPVGINDSGLVAGNAYTAGGWHPFLYDHRNGIIDLGDLGGHYPWVNGINNKNQVVGNYNDAVGNYQAFILDPVTGVSILPLDPYGNVLSPVSINDRGQVSSVEEVFDIDGNFQYHGFMYDPVGGVVDLGTLPGSLYSWALSISRYGQVIGFGDTSDGSQHGIITNSNVWMDLNDVVAPVLKWQIVSAAQLNKNGQITGYGYHQGKYRAFLMTPKAKVKSLVLAAAAVKGGSSTTGTVTLSQAAPYDLFVELKSDTVKAAVPEFVALRKGATTATFTVTTSSVTASMTAHITASFANTPFVRSLQVKK